MTSDSVISTGRGEPGDAVTLWVGAYPAEGPDSPVDHGEGIWRLDLDASTGALSGRLAITCPAPSFVATGPDGRWLYAVGEYLAGTVSAFAVDAE